MATGTQHNRKIELKLSLVVRREGKQYSSWCPELDVASCGDTVEEACEMLHEAVDLYLSALVEEGELAEVLRERGLQPSVKGSCDYLFLSSWQTAVTAPE